MRMERSGLLFLVFLFIFDAGIFIEATHLPRSDTGRASKRSSMKIPEKEMTKAIDFAKGVVDHLELLESNLNTYDIRVRKGTPSYGLLIDSLPDNRALKQGKHAYAAARATMYLMSMNPQCQSLDTIECFKQVSSLQLSKTPLRKSCEESFVRKCSLNDINAKYSKIDGSCNYKSNGNRGKSFTSYKRLLVPNYLDGVQRIRRSVTKDSLPSARLISNKLNKNEGATNENLTLSLVQWTEFIGNDMAHTATNKMLHTESSIECCESYGRKLAPRYRHPFCEPIEIPDDDPFYSQHRLECMTYVRSLLSFKPDCTFGSYEQMNQATHFLDGSQIYGSDKGKTLSLRQMKGGLLKTTRRNGEELLPLSTSPTDSCQYDSEGSSCYLSGDVRVNLHPHLTAITTIWHREHNRLATELNILNPDWSDNTLFEESRRILIAELQHITYHEYLPGLLGGNYEKLVKMQENFNAHSDPSVSNAFATAAIRFIVSMADDNLKMYKENREVESVIQLRQFFNRPSMFEAAGKVDALIRGLATQSSKAFDISFVQDLSQYLYGNGSYGFDALSLDIQRGRDHGLPSYTAYRRICGLKEAKGFKDFLAEMTPEAVESLEELYAHPDDVDLIVGGVSEKSDGNSVLGPTFSCIIAEQLIRTRNGDRYFYSNPKKPMLFTKEQFEQIKGVTLARIFCDNGDNIRTMQPNVFRKISPGNALSNCSDYDAIPKLDLVFWTQKH